ncbi:MAG: single-stranded DNA-binding protein [Treponema sp.]|jgi:single-strand DNA-binding protein|nr:single-stranded DNA-binding protein [Treponema sp.]
MNNLNSILIEGNLVKDPMLRSTQKGTQICVLRLASNRYLKQESGYEKEVSYFNVETWSRLAEICSAKGKKGRGIRVVGRIKQDRWTDPDGKLRSNVTIVAEHVEFRPEFKKSAKQIDIEAEASNASQDVPFDDLGDEEADIPVTAGKELEAVAF